MSNSIMISEEVDLIHHLGNGEYHAIFISLDEENGEKYKVCEPNCRFNKDDVVDAFRITANQNITMYISEFETLEEAIHCVSDNALGIENIQNINASEAVKLVCDKPDAIIAYNQVQTI